MGVGAGRATGEKKEGHLELKNKKGGKEKRRPGGGNITRPPKNKLQKNKRTFLPGQSFVSRKRGEKGPLGAGKNLSDQQKGGGSLNTGLVGGPRKKQKR